MKAYRFDKQLTSVDDPKEASVLLCLDEDELDYLPEGADLAYARKLVPECGAYCYAQIQQDYIVGELCLPDLQQAEPAGRDATFFMDEERLIFVDHNGLISDSIEKIANLYRDRGSTREHFLYCLLSLFVKDNISMLQMLQHQIRDIEDEIRGDHAEDFSERISLIRKKLVSFRQLYEELSDLIEQLLQNENGFLINDNMDELQMLLHRVERLQSRTQYLIENISQVRESYREMIADQQNEMMNRLTVISAIFLPLTLITGWFGMNFANMPELAQGYPYVAAGTVLLIVVMLVVMKKKKLL